jgi:hypothetical protein
VENQLRVFSISSYIVVLRDYRKDKKTAKTTKPSTVEKEAGFYIGKCFTIIQRGHKGLKKMKSL